VKNQIKACIREVAFFESFALTPTMQSADACVVAELDVSHRQTDNPE
jgi:hypothetical protein